VIALISILYKDKEFKTAFGNHILILWLQYQVFKLMDFRSDKSFSEKRKILDPFIKNYQFAGSSLFDFVRNCFQAV
jgi:hypothetical protein